MQTVSSWLQERIICFLSGGEERKSCSNFLRTLNPLAPQKSKRRLRVATWNLLSYSILPVLNCCFALTLSLPSQLPSQLLSQTDSSMDCD